MKFLPSFIYGTISPPRDVCVRFVYSGGRFSLGKSMQEVGQSRIEQT